MQYDTLGNYYRVLFDMTQYHNYSVGDVEGLIPYEKEIYVAMLAAKVAEEKDKFKGAI
jgi:hypothetical protein